MGLRTGLSIYISLKAGRGSSSNVGPLKNKNVASYHTPIYRSTEGAGIYIPSDLNNQLVALCTSQAHYTGYEAPGTSWYVSSLVSDSEEGCVTPK